MTANTSARRAKWWRFSHYELRDGRLGPVPNAELQYYDPWADYQMSRSVKGSAPPYLSLMNLLDEIRPHQQQGEVRRTDAEGPRYPVCFENWYPGRVRRPLGEWPDPVSFGERGTARILEWTAVHGLIGAAPQRVLAYQTPVADLTTEAGIDSIANPTGAFLLSSASSAILDFHSPEYPSGYTNDLFVRPNYVRLGGDWAMGLEHVPTLDAPPRCLVLRDVTRGEAVFAPVEILREFTPGGNCEFSLFPREAFEKYYCEPLDIWYQDAQAFASTVVNLTDPSVDRIDHKMATEHLNFILSSVGERLEIKKGGAASTTATYPSLLAAFAGMFKEDLLAGRRILKCSTCGAYSVTSTYQRKYCSKRCAWRTRKKRQRESDV